MDITPDFIRNVFSKSQIDPKYIGVLISPKALDIYRVAFTSITVDQVNNYELYEYMGDMAANSAIVVYFYESFPQLRCAKSINILNRLKIVHASNESFSKIGEDLGFWPFIRYDEKVADTVPLLKKSKEALLEDVFEAFVGATEVILIEEFGLVGVASQIIYNFIKSIFDMKYISFSPEDLYDAKTRLKELFEIRKNTPNPLANMFGAPKYNESSPSSKSVVLRFTNDKNLVFYGSGSNKQKSQKIAAQNAIDYFTSKGYKTEKRFNLFCDV
jgi:dsRNA-specific ribonuclease